MAIRKSIPNDYPVISELLTDLGYLNTHVFIEKKIGQFIHHSSAAVYVYEWEGRVIGLIAIDIILQLALEGDILRINYLVVDAKYRSRGIGQALEAYVTSIAVEKKCDRIEVHCHERRGKAHAFYQRQGYTESPKYFIKTITKETSGSSA